MRYKKILLLITSLIILLPIVVGGMMWKTIPEETGHWTKQAMSVFGVPLLILLIHWICIIFTAVEQNNRSPKIILWICPVLSLIINGIIYILFLL